MPTTEPPQFTVDTGLFRQLGELLVGRDSTALVELIKNAYDADATNILLSGHSLSDPTTAVLSVVDNGTGMTGTQFRRGFLRLAARGKTEGERRSPVYRRRFTGEKGVGRLAAHKLAARLEVTSVASTDPNGAPLAPLLRSNHPNDSAQELQNTLESSPRSVVIAQLDWDKIESVDTLSEVSEGLDLAEEVGTETSARGTTLLLTRLRHGWTSRDMRDVVRQLNNFGPPPDLIRPVPRSVIRRNLLFTEPLVRDAARTDPGISLEFGGEFTNPTEYWANVVRTASWILEIRARRGEDIKYALAPTINGHEANPHGRAITATRPHPDPESGPFFDARILLRSGNTPATETAWAASNSGIRIYLEGFRVLPYGEPRNDWLSLDSDYTRRGGRFDLDPLLGGPEDDIKALRSLASRDISLRLLSNRAFFGAVFLTEDGAGGLRTLVNREGFVPDDSYERLVELVNVGIRLMLRARALASFKAQKEAKNKGKRNAPELSEGDSEPSDPRDTEERDEYPFPDPPTIPELPELSEELDDALEPELERGAEVRTSVDLDDYSDNLDADNSEWALVGDENTPRGSAARLSESLAALRQILEDLASLSQQTAADRTEIPRSETLAAVEAFSRVQSAADDLIEDASLLRLLASVGSQLAAFTHELVQLVPMAVRAETALAPTAGTRWPSPAVRARRSITEVRRALERQASYLVDIASTEARRRRSRQVLRERVDAAFLAVQGAAAAREIQLINAVDPSIRTPPMFRAEVQSILGNLLTNAIKAAGHSGRVEVRANPESAGGVEFYVMNSGVSVRPDEAEQWFAPYASTTTTVDLVLGQGMGLGLPITRDLVSEYGGSVHFVPPIDGYATAIKIAIPE